MRKSKKIKNSHFRSILKISRRTYIPKQSAFEQSVGNTPLLFLKSASEIAGCNIFGKAEFMNPGGSIKDRAALWMIREAEKNGQLVRGEPGIIVEGSAGNTGIGIALAAATLGYESLIVIPRTQTVEKKDALRQAGAKLIEVDAVPYKDENHYVKIATRFAENIVKQTDRRCLYANQWDNLANKRAHIQGTGPEIWTQMKGRVDAFSCAMGTGGTLSGMADYLRLMNKDVKICLTDPKGACMYRYFTEGVLRAEGSSISEGIGQGRVTGQMVGFQPDKAFEIDDREMLLILQKLQRVDGLMMGLSSGINVAGAIEVAKTYGFTSDHTVVTVLCDSATRYASKQFNVPFLQSLNLPVPDWLPKTVSSAAKAPFPFKDDPVLEKCLNEAILK